MEDKTKVKGTLSLVYHTATILVLLLLLLELLILDFSPCTIVRYFIALANFFACMRLQAAFLAQPKWKRDAKKKELGLF